MAIYEKSSDWDWRFGKTPDFTNSIETKFPWALVDIQFDVEKGYIKTGKCFSDCLTPNFIDSINTVLSSGQITYDVPGMKKLCRLVKDKHLDDEMLLGYADDLEKWLAE